MLAGKEGGALPNTKLDTCILISSLSHSFVKTSLLQTLQSARARADTPGVARTLLQGIVELTWRHCTAIFRKLPFLPVETIRLEASE